MVVLRKRSPTKLRRIRRVTWVETAAAIPSSLDAGAAYIMGPATRPKWFVLGCPCCCGESLWLSLMPKARPRWRLLRTGGTFSAFPSIVANNCGSHFWLRDGQFIWVEDRARLTKRDLEKA